MAVAIDEAGELVEEIRPQPGPQTAFLSSPADIVVYGGAAFGGKSFGLLMEPLRHIDNEDFRGVIFRRTSPQITNPGGLWDDSHKLYPHVDGLPLGSNPRRWLFPSGARISFHHLQHEKNVYDWQGAQIPFIGFDELTHFTEQMFFYMLSRNRSMCGVRPYVRATTNPDADSWVAKLIEWWIDQESGYAIPERSGIVRWFIREDGVLEWGDSPEELKEKHGDDVEPKSLTFIPARFEDNVLGTTADPGYIANLKALPLVERERLLAGNWKIKFIAGNVFREGWLPIVNVKLPRTLKRVRYWDKAGTEGGGDWTVGVLMAKGLDCYYVEEVIRGQWSPGERNKQIKAINARDRRNFGENVDTWAEQEPGSSGKESGLITIRELAGSNVFIETVTGDKLTRAKPLAAQAEHGFVKLVQDTLENPWNDGYVQRMVAFPTPGVHDDEVDASSGAFMKLALGGGAKVFH
jgi:predicted phage terminase large subunit-like protein